MNQKLCLHPTDQQVSDSGLGSRRAYIRAYRNQERSNLIMKTRERTAAELKTKGWTERSGDRFEPVTEGRKLSMPSNIPIVGSDQMRRAGIAYNKFHREKDQKLRQQFWADFANALGFTISSARQAQELIHSEDARREFWVAS